MDTLHVDLDNMPLYVFTMKQEDYVMMLMYTCRINIQVREDKQCTIGGYNINLKYPETMQKNYQYRDSV